MSTNTRIVAATPEHVWNVLADGWLYPLWVVGASRMREVDDHWPEIGARLHHSVGSWPLLIDDFTEVLDASPASMLRLRARTWPIGAAEVTLRLSPVGTDTEVTIEEQVTSGPAALVPRARAGPAARVAQRRVAAAARVRRRAASVTHDAVVVGAGPNGLVAANLLADRGWSVLVLEAQPDVGGAVRSDEDVHPGFVHDTFSAFYPLAAASPHHPSRCGSRSTACAGAMRRPSSGTRCRTAAGRCCTATGRSRPRGSTSTTPATGRRGWSGARSGTGSATTLIDGLLTPFPPVARRRPAAAATARRRWAGLRPRAAHARRRDRARSLRRRGGRGSCWRETPGTRTSRSTHPARGCSRC